MMAIANVTTPAHISPTVPTSQVSSSPVNLSLFLHSYAIYGDFYAFALRKHAHAIYSNISLL